MRSGKKNIIMISVLLVLVSVLIVFFVLDQKERVIKQKTGYSIPSYCKIEKYVAYGSLFHRTGFEAKVRIDSADNMNVVITDMQAMLGDDYHEISLADYSAEKYALFSGTKLIPDPTSISWVIVGPVKSGTLVCFVCVENMADCYMYMYYND
jgi:hypothetical protein